MLIYQQMKVTWKVKNDDFVSGANGLLKSDVMNANGSLIVNDIDKRVIPLKNFPDEYIEKVSQETINKHLSVKDARILKQRQTVTMIPNIEVTYTLKGNQSTFLVYGDDRTVYFKKYSSRCVMQ